MAFSSFVLQTAFLGLILVFSGMPISSLRAEETAANPVFHLRNADDRGNEENQLINISQKKEIAANSEFGMPDVQGSRGLYQDDEVVFGFFEVDHGDAVIFAWAKKDIGGDDSLFRRVAERYSDELLASAKTEDDYYEWKEIRALVLGAFIGVKRGEWNVQEVWSEQQRAALNVNEVRLHQDPITVRVQKVRSRPQVASLE